MAVFTPVSNAALTDFLTGYNPGTVVRFDPITTGIQNTNYVLETTCGRFILTVFEPHYMTENDLPFFVDLKQFLADAGLPCPRPVPRTDGTTLAPLCGKTAVIVTFLDGLSPPPADLTPEHCRQAGAMLAKIHLAAQDFTGYRANDLGVRGWEKMYAACRDRVPDIAPDLQAIMDAEFTFLNQHWPRDLPTGVIHADYFPNNVFFQDETLSGVIDFYFGCNDILAYDLAIALNAWCFNEDGLLLADRATAMQQGYAQVRPLTEEEKAAMPTLLRGAAMRFLVSRCYDFLNTPPDALVTPHDPLDYLRILQHHLSEATHA